ncbi:hypothetical protein MA16_Dca025627 [Dendrobium catenatum]|uniref:Uncharacterized protein n=1 Tax=Dendrobium catenatum TaxID=906689 RepID=A0A2I0VW32_9ASPA|nr:hypothetical protein MA16_Dca025627 [Dendrobium catenatum]
MKCGGRFSCVSPSVKGTNQDQRSMQLSKRRLNSCEANVIVAPEKPNNRIDLSISGYDASTARSLETAPQAAADAGSWQGAKAG